MPTFEECLIFSYHFFLVVVKEHKGMNNVITFILFRVVVMVFKKNHFVLSDTKTKT